MKKFLFLGALAAMLLGTASCSNDMEPAMTDDGTVQFTIELPGSVDSRANISDGSIATELQVAVYKEKDDGTRTLLNDISLLGDKKVTMSNKKATVNFKLVKGQKYSFAFWAQKPGCEAYAFDASTGKVTVDYSKAVANADDGDAFTNSVEKMLVTGPMTETIYLYRPFAQLNYGDVVADYDAAVAAGIDFKQTQVTVKQVSKSYDLLAKKASDATEDLVNVTWPAAASAIGENLKVVDGDETVSYKWLSMCYFLVPKDESNVETELSLLNTAGTEFNKLTVNNVPVQKNHRTNILGNLFTDDVNFNIIIDERFQQPDNNIIMLSDAASIAAAVAVPNAVVNIEPGTNVNLDLSTIAEGVTINGNGAILKFTKADSKDADHKINKENITIANFIIDNTDDYTGLEVNVKNFTLKNCTWANGNYSQDAIKIQGGDANGVILIDGCEFEPEVGTIFKAIHVFGKSTVKIVDSTIDAIYPFNCNGSNNNMIIENSTLKGWTSWNNGNGHTVTFTNCKFGKGMSGYAVVRPYQTSTFTDCEFSADMSFQPRNESASTCNGCTIADMDHFLAIDDQEGTPNADITKTGYHSTITIDGVTYINNGGTTYAVQ